jgi:ribosomal peptide maturation radical SAM protein 1
MPKVLLIDMPFANLLTPSIGLGILKAGLTRVGISSTVLNFHLRFAELCSQEAYNTVHSDTYSEHLVGEWIFSEALFPGSKHRDFDHYFRDVLSGHEPDQEDKPFYGSALLEKLPEKILLVRNTVDSFLRECLEIVLGHDPVIVGFTSMFQQHVASLALARLIKMRRPDCFIVFGGSNCEGPMGAETLKQFEFVDVVVSGEGDFVFPELVQSILASGTISKVQGIYCRNRSLLPVRSGSPQNTPMIRDLDTVPVPDYDDYFAQLAESSIKLSTTSNLLFETSRGCWWGEKQHCTFCGLNGATMTYRSKSAERALDELIYLTDRYPGCSVNAVDNILDMKYFKSFIKLLAEREHDFGLFYEVKSNLRKDQLLLLREAGVKTIQPGIESLSDNVLRVMKKGVSALQNIQFLKWCSELNMTTHYNIIWGFPGETADDYENITALIPVISHLRPPLGSSTIRIDRFSPNFNENHQLGIGEVAPFPAYHYVYPFDPEAVFNLAYFFEPTRRQQRVEPHYVRDLSNAIKGWRQSYQHSDLFFMEKGPKLLIWDMRAIARERLVILDDYFKLAYLACDEVMTPNQIIDSCRKNSQAFSSAGRLVEILDSLVDRSLMIKAGNQYLSLAYRKSI